MDRLKRGAAWGGSEQVAPREHDGPDPEKIAIIDNKNLVAFWSCCQLERLVIYL